MRMIILFVSTLLLSGCGGSTSQIAPAPISVELEVDGRFEKRSPWTLKVDSAGNATLNVDSSPTIVKSFTVSSSQMNDLRLAVRNQSFFRLNDAYGDDFPDAITRKITIQEGSNQKTVRMRYMMYSLDSDKDKWRGIGRALNVWRCVQGWFHEPQAIDFTDQDNSILNTLLLSPPIDSRPSNVLRVQ